MALRMQKPLVRTLDTSIARHAPKAAAPIYQTPEHQAWAKQVVSRANGRCQRCGRPRRLVADHIVEIKDGGDPLDLSNGQALCWPCHTTKTAAARAARMAR